MLEDRTLLAVFPVTTLADSGAGSLRQAILNANATPGDDTITFDVTGTINLSGALPYLSTNLAIEGPGANQLTVRRNTGGNYGIFVVVNGAAVSIAGLTITNGCTSHGGGIFNAGTLTIRDTTLSGNSAFGIEDIGLGGFGGAIYNSGTLMVSNSTVSGNQAFGHFSDGFGGGIYNAGSGTPISGGPGLLTLRNSTLSGNLANIGGGIVNDFGATLTVRHSTITGNSGGISSGGVLHLGNTIVAGNSGPHFSRGDSTHGCKGDCPATVFELGGSLASSGYNLIGNSSSAIGFAPTDLLDVNPLLGPLQDNGGPTWTHALLPGSPALDAGDNADAPDFDQRGFSRIIGGTIDIGAFEVQPDAATQFVFSVPASIFSGVAFDVTVTALDAYGHVAVGYTGTVTFATTDTDPGVRLPADYTFTADDQGVHTFAGEFVLATNGELTLTATDLADGITGSITVQIDTGGGGVP